MTMAAVKKKTRNGNVNDDSDGNGIFESTDTTTANADGSKTETTSYYNDSSFGDSLTVTLAEKGLMGAKTTKVKLGGLGKQKDDFNATVGRYWHRHQVMRAQK